MQEISLDLKPSRQFLSLITFAVMGSLAIIGFLSVSIVIKMVLAILVAIYGVHIFWRYGLLKDSRSIVQLDIKSNDWYIRNKIAYFSASLLGESTVTTWVCVLRFSTATSARKQSCIIFNDSLESDQYRRLLVAIKSHGIKPQNALPSAVL